MQLTKHHKRQTNSMTKKTKTPGTQTGLKQLKEPIICSFEEY